MHEASTSVSGWSDQSISTLHHVLRAPRRRLTVGLIANWTLVTDDTSSVDNVTSQPEIQDGIHSVEVRELAREIVTIEQEIPAERASGKPYHSVYTTLSQTHLPELNDVNAVEYNSDRQTVKPDVNLPGFTVAAAVTSSIVQYYFDFPEEDCYEGGADAHTSITD